MPARRRSERVWNLRDSFGREPEQPIRACMYGHRTFGVVAEREARDSQEGCLFLDTTGIREHGRSVSLEREEIEIAKRAAQDDSGW